MSELFPIPVFKCASLSTGCRLSTAFCLASLLTISASAGDLEESIQADYTHLESLYHHLHRNPELSLQESRTSDRLATELDNLGFNVTSGVGGHGMVAVMKNGPGPTVMIRADMDALPVQEQTGLDYASEATAVDAEGNTVPVMHACGHDIHMTVFVGTARQLVERQDQWRGTLMMIAQPAEEIGAGARMMLGDGLFQRFPRPDYNLALHVRYNLPAGTVGYIEGYAYANVDSVDIRVFGVGGHGAYPHTTKDPVVLSAQIINALQTLVSRETSPLDPAVVTVGSIHGGTKHNVIPDEVQLKLTVRSYSDATRERLLKGIERVAINQARSAGLPEGRWPVVEIKDEFTPSLYNDPDLVERVVSAFEAELGKSQVTEVQPVTGGEDFARYGRVEPRIPSMMFVIGVVDPDTYRDAVKDNTQLPSTHSPFFAPVPGPTIRTGVAAMTAAALELMAGS